MKTRTIPQVVAIALAQAAHDALIVNLEAPTIDAVRDRARQLLSDFSDSLDTAVNRLRMRDLDCEVVIAEVVHAQIEIEV